MFRSIIMKNSYKKIFHNCFNNFLVCPASKHALQQNLASDKNVRLNENSLQPRILKYFADCIPHDKIISKIDQKQVTAEDYCAENLNKVTNAKLSQLISNLSNSFLKKKDYKVFIKNLDKECCARLPVLTTTEIFNYLDNFMYFMPHLITQLSFYSKAIERMNFFTEHCSKVELLQLCFYVGLQKKSRDSQKILKECLNKFNRKYVNALNLNDLAILCNSSYKTSTKIDQQKLLDKIVGALYDNLAVLNDATIFITVVKTLRHNQYRNEELLNTISNTIFFNNTIKHYSFTACTHILALYADALYYDENLFNLLTDKCLIELRQNTEVKSKNEHFTKQIRIKDIARFLWTLSYIGYEKLEESIIINYIIPLLDAYIQLGELNRNTEHFIDSILSLWIMGYRPHTKFLTTIVTRNTVSLIHGKRKQRFIARLNLLLTCIQMECKEIYSTLRVTCTEPIAPKINVQLRNRPYLKSVHNSLRNISSKFGIHKVEYSSPIPNLNIVGLIGYNKENSVVVYIELIDDSIRLRNVSSTPNGLMHLKLRLLRTLGKPILTVNQDEIEELKPVEINKYLERKLMRILPVP